MIKDITEKDELNKIYNESDNPNLDKIYRFKCLSIYNNFFFHFICDNSATRPILMAHLRLKKVKLMAERVGFEPTVPLTVHTLSKRAP